MRRTVLYDKRKKSPQLVRPNHRISAAMDQEPEVYDLENGAKVIAKRMPGKDIGIFFGFPFGLSHDFHRSHLAEHLFFRRGEQQLGIEVHEAIERIGGYFNGYTAEDFMGFPILIPAGRLNEAITILSACLTDPRVDPRHLRLEKSIVCGELDERRSDPTSYLTAAELKALFPQGHPLDIERETKKGYYRLTLKDIKQINETKFGTQNLYIGIAGPNIPKILEGIIRLTRSLPHCGNQMPKFPYSKLSTNRVVVRRPGVKDVSTYVSFLVRGQGSTDLPALELMLHILEGNNSSDYVVSNRLFRALRTETGVIYHTESTLDYFNGVGYVSFGCGGTQNRNAERVERILLHEMERLREDLVPEAEFDASLRSFRLSVARTTQQTNNPGDIAEDLVIGAFYRTPKTQREFMAQVELVTPEDLRRVANKYATPDKLLLSTLRTA